MIAQLENDTASRTCSAAGGRLRGIEGEPDAIRNLVRTRVVRLSAGVIGTAVGLLCGIGLFLITNYLVLKGGPVVGPHLALLAQVFFGYRVSFIGSLVGFAYAFVCGWVVAFAGAWLYNAIASLRDR